MDCIPLGKRIKAAREQAGLTQEDLADRLGMSTTHISVIERGVKPPKLDTFVRIANVLNVSADNLLQDVVDNSQLSAANELASSIMQLPPQERTKILNAIRALTE